MSDGQRYTKLVTLDGFKMPVMSGTWKRGASNQGPLWSFAIIKKKNYQGKWRYRATGHQTHTNAVRLVGGPTTSMPETWSSAWSQFRFKCLAWGSSVVKLCQLYALISQGWCEIPCAVILYLANYVVRFNLTGVTFGVISGNMFYITLLPCHKVYKRGD